MPFSQLDDASTSIRIRARGLLFLGPLLLILGLLAYQSWSGYQAARREAQITVANLADVLSYSIDSSLERIRADLDVFAAMLDADELAGTLTPGKRALVETNMAQSLRGFSAVLNYRAFAPNGDSIVAAGRANPQVKLNVADRAWFQQLRDTPERDTVLSDVLISRASGAPGIVFARPVRTDDGRFVGAVNAYIDLDWFQGLIDRLDIGTDGLVTLRHRDDARLLLRRPKVTEQLNESNTGLYTLHTSAIIRAEGEFVSAIDSLTRLYAFRRLENYPLTVVVAVSPDHYLKAWRLQASLTALIALLLGTIQIATYHRLNRAYGETVAMAEQLRTSNLNLQRSNAELEEFAYIASHDLQTPLRNIASFSQLLERRYKPQLGGEGREFIDFIVTNATRMSGLIQDLLAYARVSRLEQAPQPVSVTAVLEQVLIDLAKPIRASEAKINFAPLPTLTVSEHQLASLLMNLIENAIKYRAPDHPPEITIAAILDQPGLWHFTVTDNGIGIDEEHWEKIFAIFQRLHNVEAYPGTGIGLALCRRIVHRWGGRIWVQSVPGQGSTFHFTVPAATEAAAKQSGGLRPARGL